MAPCGFTAVLAISSALCTSLALNHKGATTAATNADNTATTAATNVANKQYLISSFPSMRTVAYTHLPDTVWRPLFIGVVENPVGIAVDPLFSRLFVADQTLNKIFSYHLVIKSDGLLETDSTQSVAVDGVAAKWMAVNGLGDLYFSGEMVGDMSDGNGQAVYRMDAAKLNTGDALYPTLVYNQANSGYPNSAIWAPSGVAVDSFNVFWANIQNGTEHGAVCTGPRQNIGVTVTSTTVLSKAVNEVRGLAATALTLFYLTPSAVYGIPKATDGVAIEDSTVGVIQSTDVANGWDPKSIAFDGVGTMYWTDHKAGIIYKFPAGSTSTYPLTKYVDAPDAYGLAIFSLAGDSKEYVESVSGIQTSAQATESGVPSALQFHPFAILVSVIAAYVSK